MTTFWQQKLQSSLQSSLQSVNSTVNSISTDGAARCDLHATNVHCARVLGAELKTMSCVAAVSVPWPRRRGS